MHSRCYKATIFDIKDRCTYANKGEVRSLPRVWETSSFLGAERNMDWAIDDEMCDAPPNEKLSNLADTATRLEHVYGRPRLQRNIQQLLTFCSAVSSHTRQREMHNPRC